MIIRYYAHDCALCSCPPTRNLKGVACIDVERDKVAKIDRCTRCGTAWTLRKYRWSPAELLPVAEAA